ncbi:MAG: hypothetical protein DCO99_04885 [Synechococcus sp. XM-24]|nr:MAG: hypothetical protein DCO99_04885 [Synechococcus sp. XM-24]
MEVAILLDSQILLTMLILPCSRAQGGWWNKGDDAKALSILSGKPQEVFAFGFIEGVTTTPINSWAGDVNHKFKADRVNLYAYDYSTVTGATPSCRNNEISNELPDIFPELDFDLDPGDGGIEDVPVAILPTLDGFIRLGLNILPRNPIATGGKSLQEYQNDLVDTLFERMPLRRFDVSSLPSGGDEISVSLDDVDYQEDPSLAGQYLEKDGLSAWVKGFGGSTSAFQYVESAYGEFGNWKSTHGGTALGVDYSLSDDFKLGVYGNWGNVNVTYLGLAGGDWSPNGWGGGLTATYAKENFYAQGLFGATGFSGTHNRYLLSVGSFGGGTAFATKNTTSYIGALRVGSPQQWGSVVLEPQLTGSWTHNADHAWSETGGGVFNLRYSDYSDNFLQTLLALKVSAPLNSGQRALVNPFIRIGWVADWDLNNANANANVTNIFLGRSASIPIVQDNESGILLEGGVDYTINNLGSTSFKLFAKGGAEIWGDSQKTADWRASGGVTFLFGGAPKGKPQPVVDVESTPAPQPEAVPVRGLW